MNAENRKLVADCLYLTVEWLGELALRIDPENVATVTKTWTRKDTPKQPIDARPPEPSANPTPAPAAVPTTAPQPAPAINLDDVRAELDAKAKVFGRQRITMLLGGKKIAAMTQDELRTLMNDLRALTVSEAA